MTPFNISTLWASSFCFPFFFAFLVLFVLVLCGCGRRHLRRRRGHGEGCRAVEAFEARGAGWNRELLGCLVFFFVVCETGERAGPGEKRCCVETTCCRHCGQLTSRPGAAEAIPGKRSENRWAVVRWQRRCSCAMAADGYTSFMLMVSGQVSTAEVLR